MRNITMAMGAAALLGLLAGGCGSNDSAGEVLVQFGDGNVTLNLDNVQVERSAQGTAITAEVLSDLPEPYLLEAFIENAGTFDVRLHNGGEISHSLHLDAQQMSIEFLRPTWERSELMALENGESMEYWLQSHMNDGTADCGGMPERFQDLPLQYATQAILNHLVARYDVSIDTARIGQILCSQAVNMPEDNGLGFARGLAGWEELRDGIYMPATFDADFPPLDITIGKSAGEEKNDCARESVDTSVSIGHEVRTLYVRDTNIDMTCNDATLEMHANCCLDTELELRDTQGILRKYALPAQRECNHVFTPSGRSGANLARFRFFAHGNICPTVAGNDECWSGRVDQVTPFNCVMTGYEDATGTFDPEIGAADLQESNGIASAAFLKFDVSICYLPGAEVDTIVCHDRRIDRLRPGTSICTSENLADCQCGNGRGR